MSKDDAEPRLARRALLGSGAAVAAGGIVIAGAGTAAAADGDPVLAGRTNSATSATTLNSSANANALRVNSSGSGTSASGIVATSVNAYGLIASSTGYNGARLASQQPNTFGLWAENTATDAGTGAAIYGISRAAGTGAQGGTAVRGVHGPGVDVFLRTVRTTHAPAAGEFAGPNGVIGASNQDGGIGVIGHSETSTGVYASTDTPGVDALFSNGNTTIAGDLAVQGMISKFGGSFRIDHPLDPQNQYLSHSFVESPDMKNVYDGVSELDDDGAATVQLPDWFEALNRDFRYQLTPMGASAPDLYISTEIADGQFAIAGGVPGQRISWQVTGIRKDPWAENNRIPVEHEKPASERGTMLYPQNT